MPRHDPIAATPERICSCRNLTIDVEAGRLSAKDEQAIALFREA
jgi:hypothetical protein